MGLIAGYPTGVKLISQLATTRHISPKEAQKNLIFANNCGPLFIIGTVGTILLGNTQLGYFLLLIHFLSAFTMLLLSRFYEPDVIMLTSSVSQDTSHNMAFSEIFTTAVQNGMDTIVYVGAYIIFFSVIIALFKQNIVVNTLILKIAQKFSLEPHLLHSLVLGSLEMSNGVALLSQSQSLLHLALLSALLAFGGFCVFFQSIYVGKDVNFHWISYIGAKLIQALFAFCYTLLLYPLFFLN
jgi:sporulation integral membrane protein YlbJ